MRDLLTELCYELSTEDIEEEEEAEEEEDETTHKDTDIDSVSYDGAAAVAIHMSFPGIPTNEPPKQPTIEEVPTSPPKQSDNSNGSTGIEGGPDSEGGDTEEDE
jgi:hypothetical protein